MERFKKKISINYTRYLAIQKILKLCPHKDYITSVVLMLYDMVNDTNKRDDPVFIVADKNHTCLQSYIIH